MKYKIHFHSDSWFFSGSQNMLAVLANHKRIRNNFMLSFSYGYSKDYEKGLDKQIRTSIKRYPINTHHTNHISMPDNNHKIRLFRLLLRGLMALSERVFFFSNIYKIYRIIKKANPDIIHINNSGYPGAYSCSAAVAAAKLAGKDKIVYTVNNIAVPRSSVIRRLDFLLDRFVSKRVTKFVTGSSYAGKRLQSVLGFHDDRHIRIPNTILSRNNDETEEETRKRLSVGNDDILICNVALFEERKGQQYLIEAFNQLCKELGGTLKVKLILEGKGPTKVKLTELVQSNNLNSRVLFIEEENIYNLYNCLDLFVLPSIMYEDFPNVILEVMSLGKPVIGTKIAGIPEQIEDGSNGYVVEPGDILQLKDAMKRIVTDKHLRKQMGRRSREIFDGNFKEDIIIDKYINLYESLLNVKG
ncbi:glycosyltransferase family 4 protein [Chloroflexota bacterium]